MSDTSIIAELVPYSSIVGQSIVLRAGNGAVIAKEIERLRSAVARGIGTIQMLSHHMRWFGIDGEKEQARVVRVTLELMWECLPGIGAKDELIPDC